jgi:hypothetical protein
MSAMLAKTRKGAAAVAETDFFQSDIKRHVLEVKTGTAELNLVHKISECRRAASGEGGWRNWHRGSAAT